MRNLYRSTSWRRVLALVLVFVMMFSVMGTSGYSVFAEGLEETGEAVVEPAAEEPAQEEEFTLQGESPGEEEAEAVVETEEGEVEVEAVEEAEEEAEEPAEEAVEEAVEDEEAEEPAEEDAEPVEASEEGEELEAEPAEEAEEEAEDPAEEAAEEEGEEEDTLIAEAAQIIEEDDGAEAPEEEAEEAEVVEEAAEKVAPEEEVIPEGPTSFPAAKFGGTTVTVTAEPYTFPEGTTVTIEEITLGRTQMAAVANAVEEEIVSVKAYNITFFDADGNEIQPAIPVKVSIDSKSMADMDNLQVVHIEDNNKKATVVDDVDETKGGIEFDAEHFSVYVVVEVGEGARLAVTFKNGETEIDTMYVKAADLDPDHVADILCDPGAGNVPEGCLFLGWVEESVYEEVYKNTEETFTLKAILESENKPLSIDDIRAAAKTTVSAADFHESEVVYQALILRAFTITYFGEKITNAENEEQPGVALSSTTLLVSPSAEQGTTLINMSYTPKGDTQHFEGWNVAEDGSAENIVSASAEAPYPNNTEITINGDVNLQVYAPFGLWLIFSEQLKGATYNAPQFVITGSVTQEPCEDEDMLCVGHRFLGWFADPDGEEAFEFGHELTKKTTIYACWEEYEEASYTVVVWKQHVTGNKYDFVNSISLTGEVGEAVDTVVASADGTYVTINGVDYVDDDLTGSHLKEFDQNVIVKSDGTTIVNVYYDRDIVTLNFYTNGDYTYDEAANGMYGKIDDEYVALEEITTGYKANGAAYTGTRYITTTSNDNDNPQYGVVDGAVVRLTRAGGWGNRYWTYNGQRYNGTRYLETTGDTGTQYGFVNGSMVQLTRDTAIVVSDTQEPYEGTRYEQRYVAGWQLHDTMEGRYGSTLAENSEVWPADHRWTENQNGGTTTTFLDAFLPTGGSNTMNFYGQNLQTGRQVVFLKQNADGNGYTEANRVNTASGYGTFLISDKYNGFVAYQYSTNGTTWTGVGTKNSQGYYNNGTGISYSNTLYIRFNRLTYAINFMDGAYFDGYLNPITDEGDQGQLHEPITNIAYGADISDYEDAVKPTYNGYSFAGWFVDKACTVLYDFDTMPEGGITVYAKWIQHQYRVFLHPQVPGVPTDPDEREAYLEWGDGVSLCFRVSPGETISVPTGIIKDGEYEMVGWFLDKDCETVFNKEDFLPNDSSVKTPYDKTKDMTDPMDKYGEIGENPSNSDATGYDGEDRFWITTKLDLYAKWRAVLLGAEGIGIEYKLDGGEGNISDSLLYKDSAAAIAQDAPTPANDTLRFLYWDVQKWDEDAKAYVSSGVVVNPGEAFTVLKANACIEELEGSTEENPKFSYTVRLMAKYGPAEVPTPTHITWYDNYENCPAAKTNDNLEVNEAINIEAARTRTGYTFLGWARVDNNNGATPSVKDLKESDLFLKYVDGAFKAKDAEGEFTVAATQVAADERLNYHDLYAVWKAVNYTVKFDKNAQTATGEMADESFKYDEEKALTANAFAYENHNFTGWNTKADGNGVSYADKASVKNLVAEDGGSITLYAQWEIATANYTVKHLQQDLEGDGYTEVTADRQTLTGNTGDQTAAVAKNYTGFTAQQFAQQTIAADGSTVVEIKYDRNTFTVTYTDGVANEEVFADQVTSGIRYGATTPAFSGTPQRTGYTFSGWDEAPATTVTADATYTAQWTEAGDTPYTVKHFKQTEVGSADYTEVEADRQTLTGKTGATATAEPKSYEGYTFDSDNEKNVRTGTISAKGDLVLELYYKVDEISDKPNGPDDPDGPNDIPDDEDQYTIRFVDYDDTLISSAKYAWGTEPTMIAVPADPTREGYTFTGWDPAEIARVTGPATYKATYEQITYTIIYHANYESKVESEGDEVVTAEDVTMIVTFNDVMGANEQKFSKTSPWTNGNTTYTFNSWNTKADGSGTKFTPGAYDGTGAVAETAQQPVTNDGTASAVSTSARTLRAMIATTSKGGTLELWAQWDDYTPTPGNPSRPPKDEPADEPDEEIPEDDTPLAPAEIEEDDEPEIDDGDTPYAGYEEEPDEEVAEEPTPFSPYTGDDRHTAAWGFVSLLSLAGIAVVARKRREEE